MASIKRATAEDAGLVLQLITELAEHHGQADAVRTDEETLLAAASGDSPRFGVLLAEVDGETAGFLSYTICYSIWLGDSFMQIDDVFVRDAFRGNGLGESLMSTSYELAEELGLPRIKWEVQPDNDAAIRFYERLGARGYDKRLFAWSVASPVEPVVG